MTVLENRASQEPRAKWPLTQLSIDELSHWQLFRWPFGASQKVVHWLENYVAKRKRHAIVRSALIAVAQRHPEWADVQFDQHFVAYQGAPTLAEYLRSGQLPTAAALAEAWSNQFVWQPTTKLSAQARFMPVAEDFVYILSSEKM